MENITRKKNAICQYLPSNNNKYSASLDYKTIEKPTYIDYNIISKMGFFKKLRNFIVLKRKLFILFGVFILLNYIECFTSKASFKTSLSDSLSNCAFETFKGLSRFNTSFKF